MPREPTSKECQTVIGLQNEILTILKDDAEYKNTVGAAVSRQVEVDIRILDETIEQLRQDFSRIVDEKCGDS